MAYEHITMRIEDGVATITLNRPDRLNAWTQIMEREVRSALMAADADPAVRAAVITGAGRAFCAGADMEELKLAAAQNLDLRKFLAFPKTGATGEDANFNHRFSYIWSLSLPVIAAINGPIAGIGLCLALFCDFRFIASSSRIITAFAQRGLIAEHGIAWILPRLIGAGQAMRMLCAQTPFDADFAERTGLAEKVADEELAERATQFAGELAQLLSPRSLRVIKAQLYHGLFCDFDTSAARGDEEMFASFESADFREGIAHFLEKRPPHFTGE